MGAGTGVPCIAKAVDNYELKTGPYKGQRVCVDAAEYETIAGVGSNWDFDPEYVVEAIFIVILSIDTISTGITNGFCHGML